MYLYHVTLETNLNKRKRFIPRIPSSAGKGENKTIPRICMSDSIEKCIQASPIISDLLDGETHIIKVYKYRVNKRNADKIVGPKTLFNKKLVPDALENNEFWCLKPITMESELYVVNKIEIDFDLAWTTFKTSTIISVAKLVLGNNINKININYKIKDPYKLYESIVIQLDKLKLYNEYDLMWDTLAKRPWAQIKRITKLDIKRLT